MIEEKKTEGREMSARIHKILREVRKFCEDGNQTEGDGHPECPFALCIADIDRALRARLKGLGLDPAAEN